MLLTFVRLVLHFVPGFMLVRRNIEDFLAYKILVHFEDVPRLESFLIPVFHWSALTRGC